MRAISGREYRGIIAMRPRFASSVDQAGSPGMNPGSPNRRRSAAENAWLAASLARASAPSGHSRGHGHAAPGADGIIESEDTSMLETIAVLLILLWLLGYFALPNVGGLIHILLVVAVVVVIIRLLQGRRVV
jgi:hypothetical protein